MNDEATEDDVLRAAAPRSDQLNADDLISITRDIVISRVRSAADDKIKIHYEGDNGKPWLPCKGMIRVFLHIWGGKTKDWKGRTVRLFRWPEAKYSGKEVGGIRISHMSDMAEAKVTVPVRTSRNEVVMWTVERLDTRKPDPKPPGDLPAMLAAIDSWTGTREDIAAKAGEFAWAKTERLEIAKALDARWPKAE